MRLARTQTKIASNGIAAIIHIFLTAILPIVLLVLVRLDFGWVAMLAVLLSKWRMFAVKSRHWPAILRANAVDIIVGVSTVIFLIVSTEYSLQVLFAALYTTWLLVIKPKSSAVGIGVQAYLSFIVGLSALYYYLSDSATALLVVVTWCLAYFTARHFLSAFDESMSRATSYAWAFFAACIAWLSGHWLIFYGPIAQPVLLLGSLGFGLGSIYYLEHTDKLTIVLRRQFIAGMAIAVLVLIVFSDWSDKTI